MQKAFLFDLDGVLINNELVWEQHKKVLYEKYFGVDITQKLGSTLGINMEGIYERAVALGAKFDKQELFNDFFESAKSVYAEAPLAKDLDRLFVYLAKHKYRVGIVSASPMAWIQTVISRLHFVNDLDVVISLHDLVDLRHKPHPDGYIHAMELLGVEPTHTFVLEDSNSGIASAKASGAITIGFQENLIDGYEQKGADVYAKDVSDVIAILEEQNV